MLVGLSTGTIYKWNSNIDNLIKICKNDIKTSGLELMLADKKSLENIVLSDNSIKWLRNLKHLTLHSPPKIVSNSENQLDIENQLCMMQKIYDKINAKALVFHVTNLPDINLLNKFNFKFIIENTTRKGSVDLEEFTNKVKKYKCDVCLDISHAYTWSNKESLKYWSRFEGKIFQIHLSSSHGTHQHLPFTESDDDFISSIEFIRKINVPIIIESDYNNKNVKFLIKDITAIQDFLHSG